MSLGKVYLASGWFSPEWLEEVENIKSVFEENGISYFSPKDENLCDEDASESFQDQVFAGNIKGMNEASWMLCNTRNKDMGTLFEAGYFHCLDKPIVYFAAGLPPGATAQGCGRRRCRARARSPLPGNTWMPHWYRCVR